ncbi:MAG: parvulin peptidyl-prolyl isomerase [Methylophaga sp.]|nr:MAG: parvulin peptidyl-prolyl isomerase [Methylophaga sp.]
MLNFIRVHAQGWVAWLIVGLISIPFALWGVNSYLTGPSSVVVAKVNGEEVLQTEYQRALQQYRDQMRTQMGEKFDPEVFDRFEIKQAVLNGIVDKKLLRMASHDIGQQVSDKSIFNNISTTAAFQKDGQFDVNIYNRLLARSGLTPSSFEAQLRSDMLSQEISSNIQQSGIIGDYFVNDISRLENQVREVAYGVIYLQDQAELIEINDVAVRNHFEQHAASYLAPEQMVVDYIELSIVDLSKEIELDEEKLQQFYSDNESQFIGPEQRQISHILIEQDEQQALETVAIIKGRLEEGEEFSVLAAEFSQDPGSANEGGDLGLFQRTNIETAFELTVFDEMNEGDISDPIKTEFGYHLVKVTKVQLGEGQSFTEARQDIETMYKQQQAEELFYEKAQLLADLSYENPDDLTIASEELGLAIKTSSSFARGGGSGIASERKVLVAAFSEDVLVNDLNSSVIELSKDHMMVLRKNKHTQSSQLPFESVAPSIREQLRYELARDQSKQQGQAIIEKIKAGESASNLFNEGSWQSEQLVSRASTTVNRQILEQVFSTPRPEKENKYAGFTADNGNYIVVQLSAVLEGDAIPDHYPQKENDNLQAYLVSTYSESELRAFVASLKESADIEIYEQFL